MTYKNNIEIAKTGDLIIAPKGVFHKTEMEFGLRPR
jgi:hypothetical protein